MSDEGGFVHFDGIPTWKFIEWGARSVLEQESNPEETVFVSVTARELALLVFATVYTAKRIVELAPDANKLLDKLKELTEAQDFKPTTGG